MMFPKKIFITQGTGGTHDLHLLSCEESSRSIIQQHCGRRAFIQRLEDLEDLEDRLVDA